MALKAKGMDDRYRLWIEKGQKREGPGKKRRTSKRNHQESSSVESWPCLWQFYGTVKWLPFFFEQVEGKSLSSTFTEGLLHFILQKKERRAPEHNRDGPGVISVLTGSPAANQYTKCDKLRVVLSVRRGECDLEESLFFSTSLYL